MSTATQQEPESKPWPWPYAENVLQWLREEDCRIVRHYAEELSTTPAEVVHLAITAFHLNEQAARKQMQGVSIPKRLAKLGMHTATSLPCVPLDGGP